MLRYRAKCEDCKWTNRSANPHSRMVAIKWHKDTTDHKIKER